VGFAEDRLAWQSDANKLRDEIAERNSKLTKEERESEYLFIMDEECSQQRKKVAAGEYMSILPLDPFTASAALLDLALNITREGDQEASDLTQAARDKIGEESITAILPEFQTRIMNKKEAAKFLTSTANEQQPLIGRQHELRNERILNDR